MITKTKVTLKDIIKLMDKNYSLYYVDYSDSLENSLDKVQDAIHGNFEALDEMFMDWDTSANVTEYINQLRHTVANKFKLEYDELDELFDDNYDDIRNEIESRDDSTPLKDLIRNTNSVVMFYDTGFYIDDYTYDLKNRINDVKRVLKIKDNSFDNVISMMCQQASYGGQLVVYFNQDLDDVLDYEKMDKATHIHFGGNISIAIVDHNNGSGDSCEIRYSFEIPFNRKNIFIDETIKYNYTYAVCGMSSDWCKGTEMTLVAKKGKKKEVPESVTNKHLEREKQLNATFKAGKCTPLDMDIRRHRKAFYRNEFPCGNKCEDCGTFWID